MVELGLTAKQFFEEMRDYRLSDVIPDMEFNGGKAIEIDDGLRPFPILRLQQFAGYSCKSILLGQIKAPPRDTQQQAISLRPKCKTVCGYVNAKRSYWGPSSFSNPLAFCHPGCWASLKAGPTTWKALRKSVV